MGLLTIENEITEEFLAQKKFYKSYQWGNPKGWDEGSVFFEYIDLVDEFPSIILTYFPPTFDKFVTYFAFKSVKPAGNVLVNFQSGVRKDFHIPIENEGDIIYAINKAKQIIKEY